MNPLDQIREWLWSHGFQWGEIIKAREECLAAARGAIADERGHVPELYLDRIGSAGLGELKALTDWFRDKAATRRVNGLDLPETGRSSVEGTFADRLGSALSFWGTVSPVIDFEMLSLLKRLWIFNPDLSQYVANVVNLGNTGHQLQVDASSPRRAEAAVKRLNESAGRLYSNGAGIDGLINAYLAQIAWSGALSSEDVVNFRTRRVEEVVLVPVEQIRFRYREGKYVAHQQPGVTAGLVRSPLGLIELNAETYRYYALQTVDNSPYAKPPATAAVAAITGPQTDMLDNVKYILKKFGLLGLMSIMIERPEQDEGESWDAYMRRLRKYQFDVASAAQSMTNTGLVVTYDDQKPEHHNITGDSKGAADIHRLVEEHVFSGMATFPAFHGRTDSTTETYANVVYNFMLAQSGNMQRLAKRRQERTDKLDLRLAGLEVYGLSLLFNRAHARDPLEEANAEKVRTETAILKAEKGILSPDEVAQELGYDSAYDPTLLSKDPAAAKALRAMRKADPLASEVTINLRFDKGSQSYRYVPSVIQLSDLPQENLIPTPTDEVDTLQ